jgi:uncharacterized membrane protein
MPARLKPSYWLGPALYCLAVLLLLNLPVSAKELRVVNFNANIDVLADSSVDVTENIQFQFIGSPWHGVYRTIPVEYAGPHGLNYSLLVDVNHITDENGNKLRYETSRERQYLKLKIYVPNADNSTHTISINYTVSDALRFFDDHDEFYWNVTGDEWAMPIAAAAAHITLPAGASDIRANAFTGAYRSAGRNAVAEVEGTGVDVHTTAPLGMNEGLTVAVAFDKGAVREPTAFSTFLLYMRSNWPLGIPVVAFPVMFWWWWKRGRDPRLRPITTQYEPPDKLTPGEVGTLVDNSVDMRDITASIVDLAVRGYLTIQEHQKDHMLGLTHSKEFTFQLNKSPADWASLQPHEQELLEGLFGNGQAGETVSLADLQNRFYQNIPGIKSDIFGSLVGRGYYAHRPDSVRATYIGFAIVAAFLVIGAGTWFSRTYGMAPAPFIISGILTGLIIGVFAYFMPARTQSGATTLEKILGFEDFLNHVEADRFNRMVKTPEMFEKFLPFAMALGVEKNWSKAFQNIYTQPPGWYQGGNFSGGFYPYLFVNNLSAMSMQTGTALASAPRSSEGSGFSGDGGFSGGGFGGGGGGGF